METEIKNSVVATDNSTISNATIKGTQSENTNESATIGAIKNSIVAQRDSQITGAVVDIKHEKKKSFWKGFIGGVITSVVASAIWYFIQRIIET